MSRLPVTELPPMPPNDEIVLIPDAYISAADWCYILATADVLYESSAELYGWTWRCVDVIIEATNHPITGAYYRERRSTTYNEPGYAGDIRISGSTEATRRVAALITSYLEVAS